MVLDKKICEKFAPARLTGRSFPGPVLVVGHWIALLISLCTARGEEPTAVPPPHWFYEHDQKGALLGAAIAGVGDVDEDGFADFLVGAPTAGSGTAQVYLFSGATGGPGGEPRPLAFGGWSRSGFGRALAYLQPASSQDRAGILVGAGTYQVGVKVSGRAALFRWARGAVVSADPASSLEGRSGSLFGQNVCCAGDVNRDGFADVLIGAPRWSGEFQREGAISLHFGSAAGFATKPAWSLHGGQRDCQLGNFFAGEADVNHDGYADVLVGSVNFSNEDSSVGMAQLFLGGNRGLSATPVWTNHGSGTDHRYGGEVAFLGDINGDGFVDAAVSAISVRGGSKPGMVFVYLGSNSGLHVAPDCILQGEQSEDGFGGEVAGVGDLNGDGLEDFAIGAARSTAQVTAQGRLYLYLGNTNVHSIQPTLKVDGGKFDSRFAQVVQSVGDLNGDRLPDFAVGSPHWNTSQGAAGRIDVFFGSRTAYTRPAHWVIREKELVHPEDLHKLALTAKLEPAHTSPPPLARPVETSARPWFWYGVSALGVAAGIALGLQRQRRRATRAVAAERARIARDLHDDLGARLTAMSLAPSASGAGDQSAREMLQAMQEIVWAVSPENDTLESLVEFLGQKADELLAAAGIRSFHDFPLVVPPTPLSATLRKNLFLAVREALTNVVKHANATEVWLRVHLSPHQARFVVEDNGTGFTAGKPTGSEPGLPSGGNGLNNLRRRMQELNGTVEFNPRPTGGSQVCFTFPLVK